MKKVFIKDGLGLTCNDERDVISFMQRGGCVYIMTNNHHTVLYTGITSDLVSRIQQHISKLHPTGFTAKYNIKKLVYYCFFPTIEEAIAEEKRIKGGSREKRFD